MGKLLSTFVSTEGSILNGQYCEIHANIKEEYFYIKWFTPDKNEFYRLEFLGKSLHDVEEHANNWLVASEVLS
jgi:hypothetical protein|tara:strand:+ start:12139 stop:12357 length:219 start_codon:yes stop_codon:yes gene_type:complete